MADWNFPSDPILDQEYTFGVKTWRWNGRAWDLVPISDALVQQAEDAAAEAKQYRDETEDMLPIISDTAPTDVLPGQTWINPSKGRKYIWVVDEDSSQWVEAEAALLADSSTEAEELRNDLYSSVGADLIGYMGITQADRNKDSPSINDFSGNTFSEKFINAVNNGGPFIIPPGNYDVSPMTLNSSKKVTIYADGVTFKAVSAGNILNFGNTSFSIHGLTFDLTDHTGVGTNSAIYSDGSSLVELIGVSFINGSFGARIENVGHFHFERCYGINSLLWHLYVAGCDSGTMLYNRIGGGLYDGLKVAGIESGTGTARTSRRIVAIGNVTWDNTRDGIDFALNTGYEVIFALNESYNDKLRAIDFKNVYQGQGITDFIITSNICIKKSLTGDLTCFNIEGDNLSGPISRGKFSNNITFCDSTNQPSSSSLRLHYVKDTIISNNKFVGSLYGIRITGQSSNIVIENNNISYSQIGIECYSIGTGTPDKIIIRNNDIDTTNYQGGVTGSAVALTACSNAEIYNNNWNVTNAQYSVLYESTGASSTNTKLGKNYRGWSNILPVGMRALIGETWRNPTVTLGMCAEWVCCVQTSSTSSTSIFGLNQQGHRSSASSPVGSVTPYFIGERYFDGQTVKWWTSYGNSNTSWV